MGQYRVLALYDLDTNDFIRLPDGSIDQEFDALYIKCRDSCKINHAYNNILQAYIGSKGIGHNILKNFYLEYIGENLPLKAKFDYKKNIEVHVLEIEKMYKEIEANGIIFDIEDTDGEVTFLFKANDIDKIAKFLKPSTYGASISPFSTKNLPKAKYKIPDKDMNKYKKIISEVSKDDILKLAHLSSKFEKTSLVKKKVGKDYDMKAAKKKSMLKSKEFYHSIGIWDEYLNFLTEQIKIINN